MMRKWFYFLASLLLLFIVGVFLLTWFMSEVMGCRKTQSEPERKLEVLVSVSPYAYVVERIGDNLVHVTTLVPKGSNPETYEPTARQMVETSAAQLYFLVGSAASFEQVWVKRIVSTNPHLRLVDTSRGIVPVRSDHGHDDPHLWMSTNNLRIIARHVAKALEQLCPEEKEAIRMRLRTYLSEVDSAETKVKQTLMQAPTRTFMVYHPALTYFARDNGLTQMALEHEGKEPSARQMAEIIDEARSARVRLLLVQQGVATRNAEVVASALKLRTMQVQPLAPNVLDEMKQVAKWMGDKQINDIR